MRAKWTPERVEQLREWKAAGHTNCEIAAFLHTTTAAVKSAVRAHSLAFATRRRLSAEERAFIAAEYSRLPVCEIARRLGRNRGAIYRLADRMGLASERQFRWTPEAEGRLRELNAAEWTDTAVAREFGCDRKAIGERRRALGLPHRGRGPMSVASIRRGVRRQLDRLGLSHLHELRIEAWRRKARDLGWPASINGRATSLRYLQILELLWTRGPQTRESIARAIGWTKTDQRRLLNSNGKGGSYLAELMRAGLVAHLGRCVGGRGRSRNVYLYMLAAGVEPAPSRSVIDAK